MTSRSAAGVERWAFIADWLDPNSGVRWTYQLFAYLVSDGPLEIEMFDIKNKRHFLKRVKCDTVEAAQLYVGSTVTIFARQLHIIAYGDEASKRAVEARSQRTLALILPDAVQHTGKIMNAIYTSGFSIINLRMCQLSAQDAYRFLSTQHCDPQHPPLVGQPQQHLASGPVVAMELMAAQGVRRWLDILGDARYCTPGPEKPDSARQHAPDSIKALFGSDTIRNAAYGSGSVESAASELAFFFGSSGSSTAGASVSTGVTYGSRSSRGGAASSSGGSCGQSAAQVVSCCRGCGTTLGVVLPHAVKDGLAGLMLEEIQAGFQVTGLQQFCLPKQAAAEFLEVYKGVVPPGEFSSMVDELVGGPCIAIEVAPKDGSEPVEAFRQLAGLRDPELARVLRPNTLRARFGVSRVRNSIHCTDLVEDGPLEASYFFSVLQQPTALAH